MNGADGWWRVANGRAATPPYLGPQISDATWRSRGISGVAAKRHGARRRHMATARRQLVARLYLRIWTWNADIVMVSIKSRYASKRWRCGLVKRHIAQREPGGGRQQSDVFSRRFLRGASWRFPRVYVGGDFGDICAAATGGISRACWPLVFSVNSWQACLRRKRQ